MKPTELLETERLLLRKPTVKDAELIFSRYASDPEVTRYMSWPTHRTIADTQAFLAWSDADWDRWPAGTYLVFARGDGQLLGATGLSFQTPGSAVTGYVLARDAWGKGFATEALRCMVELAGRLGVRRLDANCHVEHRSSARVMEKCGFVLEEIQQAGLKFPNLETEPISDIRCYARLFEKRGNEAS
jgi:[ribosomal protein S5]-alanine N-acetyltransferase